MTMADSCSPEESFFVPDAGVADLLVCVARNGDSLTLLPIERAAAGLKMIPMPSDG